MLNDVAVVSLLFEKSQKRHDLCLTNYSSESWQEGKVFVFIILSKSDFFIFVRLALVQLPLVFTGVRWCKYLMKSSDRLLPESLRYHWCQSMAFSTLFRIQSKGNLRKVNLTSKTSGPMRAVKLHCLVEGLARAMQTLMWPSWWTSRESLDGVCWLKPKIKGDKVGSPW